MFSHEQPGRSLTGGPHRARLLTRLWQTRSKSSLCVRRCLVPEETARGHAASACRSQHVQRAHMQHMRASEGAPLSRQVERARRAKQYDDASQYLPHVSRR
jgi:hypothetical protein